MTRDYLLYLFSILQPPIVWTVTRYISRTRDTTITDFFVIAENEPLFISKHIEAMQLNYERGHFTIPPGQTHPGLVLHKTDPKDVIKALSIKLYGRDILGAKEL